MADVDGDFTKGVPVLVKRGDHLMIQDAKTGEKIFDDTAENFYGPNYKILWRNQLKFRKVAESGWQEDNWCGPNCGEI